MTEGTFSENGFRVVADNALDLLTATHAAGAGMISANVQKLGHTLHADLASVQSTILSESRRVSSVNQEGFARLNDTVQSGLGEVEQGVARVDSDLQGISHDIKGIEALSAVSVAVQAAGIALTVGQLIALRGDVRKMHGELAEQGKQLIELQKLATSHLERLSAFAERTLATQEQILETLVTSRTSEAKQLIRQGWDNLKGGFDDDAYCRFLKSLEYDNTVYVTHAELARLCEQRKEDAQAEEHHRRAVTFSESAGGEIKGFAHIQSAAFLERHDRLQECISHIRAALDCLATVPDQSKAVETQSRWRFYLAEISAKSGEAENAFQALKRSIELDARFFTAAMASESLQHLQPDLSRFLVQTDAYSRNSALETLQEASTFLSLIQVMEPKKGEDFQKNAASCLERMLVATFEQLGAAHREAHQVRATAEALPDQISTEMVQQVESQFREVEAKIKDEPVQKGLFEWIVSKRRLTKTELVGVFMMPFLWGGLLGQVEAGKGLTLRFVVYVIFLILLSYISSATIYFLFLLSYISSATIYWKLYQRKQDDYPTRKKEWAAALAHALDNFQNLKMEKLVLLKMALERINSPALRGAIARIEAIKEKSVTRCDTSTLPPAPFPDSYDGGIF